MNDVDLEPEWYDTGCQKHPNPRASQLPAGVDLQASPLYLQTITDQ